MSQAQRRIEAIHNYLQQYLGVSGGPVPSNPPPFTTPRYPIDVDDDSSLTTLTTPLTFVTQDRTTQTTTSHLSSAKKLANLIEEKSGPCGVRDSGYLPHLPLYNEPDLPRSRKARVVWSDEASMGSAPAPRGTFPWMVSLFVLISGTGEALFMCAGTLLTPNLVVTAAHCFTNNDREDTWFARVGDNYILTPDPEEQTFRVKKIIKHEKFDPLRSDGGVGGTGDGRHDIALLVLRPTRAKSGNRISEHDGLVKFGLDVRPVCVLPQSDYPTRKFYNLHCEIAGWGMTEYNNTGSYPDSIRAARISVGDVPDYYCNYLYRRDVRRTGKFCAGGTVDACQEDSGGPLVCQFDDGRFYLVGIVSSGKGCGVYPGLYTDVSRYMDWLAYWVQRESV